MIHLNDSEDRMAAKARIRHFILKRPHAAFGYLTPMEFQRKNLS